MKSIYVIRILVYDIGYTYNAISRMCMLTKRDNMNYMILRTDCCFEKNLMVGGWVFRTMKTFDESDKGSLLIEQA